MPHMLPRTLSLSLGLAALSVGLATPGFAQRTTTLPAPGEHAAVSPPDVVVGSGNYSPIVQDLDKAIEFYGGLLGLTVPPAPTPGPRPVSTDPALLNMFGVPGAQLRYLTARIPGAPFGVEIVEVRGRDKKAVRPRVQDAGNATLILLVRDIAAALAPLKKAGVPIVTPGGEPMAIGSSPSIIVSDPDGHYVELRQPVPLPATTAPADSNIIGARVRFTVASTEQTLRVYRDVLHMQPQVGEFQTAPLLGLMGLKGVQTKVTTIAFPVSELLVGFLEMKGVTGTPVRPALSDPGATRFQIRVKDLDATIVAMKAAGSTVISAGGVPANLNGGTRAAIMPDPNGIYLVLIQAPPRPAAD